MLVVKCAQFHPKSPLTDPTIKGDVFYVTLHILNIKTQTMCKIKGYLIFCNMAVLTCILYNDHVPYLHKCIH